MGAFTSHDGDHQICIDEYATTYGRRSPTLQRLDAYKLAIEKGYKYYAEAFFMGGITALTLSYENKNWVTTPIDDLKKRIKATLDALPDRIKELEDFKEELQESYGD